MFVFFLVELLNFTIQTNIKDLKTLFEEINAEWNFEDDYVPSLGSNRQTSSDKYLNDSYNEEHATLIEDQFTKFRSWYKFL